MSERPVSEGLVGAAAANNAAWCAALCRAHGIATRTDRLRWWSARRTPRFYPDAVTLDPATTTDEVLQGIDTSAGCSVKDSFGSLEMSAAGFEVLFGASWIHHPAPVGSSTSLRTESVQDVAGLDRWTRILGDDASGVFLSGLLTDPTVRLISVLRDDAAVGAAVLNRAAAVVGMSNLVSAAAVRADVLAGVLDASAREFPGLDVVGYESGEDLEQALAAGFSMIGSLRIWGR